MTAETEGETAGNEIRLPPQRAALQRAMWDHASPLCRTCGRFARLLCPPPKAFRAQVAKGSRERRAASVSVKLTHWLSIAKEAG